MLINEYSPDVEIRNFPNLDQQLEDYYDIVIKDENTEFKYFTPRGRWEYRIAYREIFYYISWLYDNDPKTVIDIGAGENLFKKWFPNIIALEPYFGDNIDFRSDFDSEFVDSHREFYDCGMAINSLHFSNIKDNVLNAMSIIKPKGRFLFTINHSEKIKPAYHLELTIDMFLNLPFKIVLFDVPSKRNIDTQNNLNGSIRVILEKS